MKEKIEGLLKAKFQPVHLEVENESHLHRVKPGAESHFKVVVVVEKFSNLNLLERHRSIYESLAEPLASGVHALAIHAFSVDEWEREKNTPGSPLCPKKN